MKNKEEINLISPLIWAYVGDSVYETYIRTKLVNFTNLHPNKLHTETIKYVKASSQAKILDKLLDKLSEEEKEIVRRTRNVGVTHIPKNANLNEYIYATALEGLIGYLYLTKQDKRLEEILEIIFEI
jgi:ribonuclease-3 family protein